jgi:hypothetical protein
MDIAAALKDIDAALNDPSAIAPGKTADVELSTRYHACIRRNAPPGSTWREQADRFIQDNTRGRVDQTDALWAVLTALRSDVASGKLALFEELVHAEVYADLLAQADGLRHSGFHRAATVVAGAALEEHVKKLATKHGTGTTRPDGTPKKASTMNSELKAAGVYNEAQRATVEGWQKLRNGAAHGDPGFEPPDSSLVPNIEPMITGVRGFVAAFPA